MLNEVYAACSANCACVTPDFADAALDAFLAQVPKIQLHCHLEGALRAATFIELCEAYRLSTRYRPGEEVEGPREIESVYQFADFREFLLTFAAVNRALRTPGDYARMAREFVADALAQRVIYGEIFVSPSVWEFFHPELDLRDAFAAIVHELRAARVHGAEFALIVDLTRNFGPQSALATARLAASLTDADVIGIGLGGDEARFPAPLFAPAFEFARAHGLHAVAHAGEADGPQSVSDAVEVLHAERIGHGVRAIEDPTVVELIRARGIPLEMCPTSNFLTGVCDREREHPFMQLDRAGVLVTIDADDPTLFGTSITDEYRYVAQCAGRDTLVRFVEQAADASFLDNPARNALKRRLHAELVGLR